jgi:hypothetical protein
MTPAQQKVPGILRDRRIALASVISSCHGRPLPNRRGLAISNEEMPMGTSNERAFDDIAEPGSSDSGGADDAANRDRESAKSGVRAAPAFGARLEAALAASARTEATLADLFRTSKFLSATIASVREANSVLARELESLAEIVAGGGDERAALAGRIQRLERILDDAAEEAVRERQRLVTEHDNFIAMLVADHERELESLRKRLADMAPPTLRNVR